MTVCKLKLIAILSVCALLSSFLYFKTNYNKKDETIFDTIESNFEINDKYTVLRIRDNKITQLNILKKEKNLLIIFTIDDCISCFNEVPFWNKIDSIYKNDIEIVGIIHGNSIEKIDYYIKMYNIKFPLYLDFNSEIFNDLGLIKTVHTPVKLLFNKDGTLIYLQGSVKSNKRLQDQFESKLESI